MKKVSLKPKLFIPFVIIYAIIYYFFAFLFPVGKIQQIGLGIGSFFAPFIAMIFTLRKWQREDGVEKGFWGFLFFGTLFYFIGQGLSLFHYFISESPSFPNEFDILFLLYPFLFLLGLIHLVNHVKNRTGMAIVLIDIFITVIVIFIICWYFFLEPMYLSNQISKYNIIVSICYPLFELLILFGLFHIRFLLNIQSLSSSTLNWLITAIFLSFIKDSVSLILSTTESRSFGSVLDPLSAMSFLLIGLSTLYTKEIQNNRSFPWIQKYMNQNALHTIGIIVLSLLFIPHILYTDILFFMFFVGILLILFRQLLMLKENKELNRLLNQTARQLEEKNEQLKKTVKKLESMNRLREIEAKTDYLTGTYNRRFMEQLMHAFIKDANCSTIPFSVLLIDIDRFKSVNDQFGHDFGDKILFDIALLFQRAVRKSDVVGRLGGEEFIILLPSTQMDAAVNIAERMRRSVEQYTFQYGEIQLQITISIGVTSWNTGDSFDKMYRRVDEALYEAKNIRNKVVYRKH